MERLPALYRRRGIPFFFDPGQQIVRLSAAALKNGIRGSLGLLGNDYEIALIMKKTRLSKKALLSSAKTVVTTLGPKGSMIETGTSRQRIAPAKPIKVVDPTGAGDAFRAGLLFGLFHGWTMKKAAQFGSVTAVYAVEFYGTQVPKLTRTSAFTRYYRTFGERV
jgi:adenosine kinase